MSGADGAGQVWRGADGPVCKVDASVGAAGQGAAKMAVTTASVRRC
jgi:hypothetical protein